jgi:hypothetical protein
VPFDLIAAGTCAAIEESIVFAVVAVVAGGVELELLLELLPQPASARSASAGTPIRARSLLIGVTSCWD